MELNVNHASIDVERKFITRWVVYTIALRRFKEGLPKRML